MQLRTALLVVCFAAAATVGAVIALGGGREAAPARAAAPAVPGEPGVSVISPRNGARQTSTAVVVKVRVHDFQLSPRDFGGEPLLGEGHIRFGLNRVPDCVDPAKLQRAIESPFGNGRLVGASFDFPEYSGPNGVLAERIGSAGSYSPATRPEIYYHDLKPGFYRLVVNLAQNDGSTTPFHAVTNFQILPRPGHGPKCTGGKVPSVKAAAFG
ncbi:MAG TPA: hypothetical protein VHU14_09435 [Solirubrobacterales bacterium]|jgi:hypothetical protein|nr:hypothetical protein [Solirubrobacterales bacterium]